MKHGYCEDCGHWTISGVCSYCQNDNTRDIDDLSQSIGEEMNNLEYEVALLLHKHWPEKYGKPYIQRDNCNEPIGCRMLQEECSADRIIRLVDKPFTPLTEWRDLWPLVQEFAEKIINYIVESYRGKDGLLTHDEREQSHHKIIQFWSTIAPESFLLKLKEYLEAQDE